jgi:hypothetical protein
VFTYANAGQLSTQGKPYIQKQNIVKNIHSAFVTNITSLTFTLYIQGVS